MRDYNKDLATIREKLDAVNTNAVNLSPEEYAYKVKFLTDAYLTTMDRKQHQEDVYNSILNEDDKNLYDASVSIGIGKIPNITDDDGNSVFHFNDFFTLNDVIQESRTIDVGSILYNQIDKYFTNKGIDLESIGIRKYAAEHEFIIKRDEKAYIEFAKAYQDCLIGDGPFKGLLTPFRNTANDLFGSDGTIHDGDYLQADGLYFRNLEKDKTKLEEKWGIKPYYTPIIIKGNVDIERMQKYVFGDKSEEINLVDKNFNDVLSKVNLTQYDVYVNEDDMGSGNGGYGSLSLISDPNKKAEIQKTITGILEGNDEYSKLGGLTYGFSTSGYQYGTTIRIPKGNGYYDVFVENLFPSKTAQDYVNHPFFQADAYIQTIKAIGKSRAQHTNNLGNTYTGYFKSDGTNINYSIPGYDDVAIGTDEAVMLKMYSDMFRDMCYTNSATGGKAYDEKDIIKFLHQEEGSVNLINILSNITGEDPIIVENNLMDMYRNYYSK